MRPGEQLEARPRRDNQGHGEREQHADTRIDRNRAHIGAHETRHERHWQQRRNNRERGENGRPADLVDRRRNRLEQALPAHRHVTMDVLDDNDRVIDEDTDRENQREQRHAVDSETPCPRRKQCQRERDNHGRTDHHGLAPAERNKDQDYDRGGRKREFLDQLFRLVVRRLAVVPRHRVLDAVRDDDPLERRYALNDL